MSPFSAVGMQTAESVAKIIFGQFASAKTNRLRLTESVATLRRSGVRLKIIFQIKRSDVLIDGAYLPNRKSHFFKLTSPSFAPHMVSERVTFVDAPPNRR